MFSRKKTKGQARKAAKASKKVEDGGSAAPNQDTLMLLMQRLRVAECMHGHTPLQKDDIYVKFGEDFFQEFKANEGNEFGAYQATRKKYAEIYEDETKLKVMVKYTL